MLRDDRQHPSEALRKGARDSVGCLNEVVHTVRSLRDCLQHTRIVVRTITEGEDARCLQSAHALLHGLHDLGCRGKTGVGHTVGEQPHRPHGARRRTGGGQLDGLLHGLLLLNALAGVKVANHHPLPTPGARAVTGSLGRALTDKRPACHLVHTRQQPPGEICTTPIVQRLDSGLRGPLAICGHSGEGEGLRYFVVVRDDSELVLSRQLPDHKPQGPLHELKLLAGHRARPIHDRADAHRGAGDLHILLGHCRSPEVCKGEYFVYRFAPHLGKLRNALQAEFHRHTIHRHHRHAHNGGGGVGSLASLATAATRRHARAAALRCSHCSFFSTLRNEYSLNRMRERAIKYRNC
eukprot:Hpha_TRINITY_DN15976_c1_g2::TRINITY_DN15976_c1_g2_i1::g.73913::m.73913